MSLTNCSDCKYYNLNPYHLTDMRCSIEPAYAIMYSKLKDLEASTLASLPLDNCSQFELNPQLTPLTLSITLTRQEWKFLALQAQLPQFSSQLNNLDLNFDSGWIQVSSSCIDAISYNQQTSILKIRFHTGSEYEYRDVSSDVFADFQAANSKGRFFNQSIKDVYDYSIL